MRKVKIRNLYSSTALSSILLLIACSVSPIPVPTNQQSSASTQPGQFADGIWVVGSDMQPGTYRNGEAHEICYWARLRGFGGELGDIISNHSASSVQTVTIQPSDTGFESSGCGTWTLINPASDSKNTVPDSGTSYIPAAPQAPIVPKQPAPPAPASTSIPLVGIRPAIASGFDIEVFAQVPDPSQMVFDASGMFGGRLYVVEQDKGQILSIDPKTGDSEIFASGFSKPLELTFGPDGLLYVSEIDSGTIWRIYPGHDGAKEVQSFSLKGSVIATGVVDAILDNADDVWEDIGANVTPTVDTTDKKEGTASGELAVATDFTTGLIAYENLPANLDLSSYDSLGLWIKSDTATTLGQLELIIDDSAGCDSPVEKLGLPPLAANTWKHVTVGITDSTTRTAIACVGLNVATDLSTSADVTLNFDHIVAQGQVTGITLLIAHSVEGGYVNLTQPRDTDRDGISDSEDRQHWLQINYFDSDQAKQDLHWTTKFIGANDGDEFLELGESAEITISLEGLDQATPLRTTKEFTLELQPSGITVQRTTPDKLDSVMNLR